MRILLASHVFPPSIGGIETMSVIIADEFARQGHEVKVVTQTPNPNTDNFAYEVIRRPKRRQLLQVAGWCDVFFQNNISLQTVWVILVTRKPWIVTHQTWIARPDGGLGWQDRGKRLLCRCASNISISQAIADHLPVPSAIIGNCYQDDLFRELPHNPRERELVFLGRLVSDKGADILLTVLGLLKGQGCTPRLTVIGSGPELSALQQMARNLQIDTLVDFVGAKSGEELVSLLNSHQIMVVPSRWKEPFGIVALEGIACGCVVVGSEGGGLKDAIGPCGKTFPNGDAAALAQVLGELLSQPERLLEYRKLATQHLARHTRESVASAYLRVFEAARR